MFSIFQCVFIGYLYIFFIETSTHILCPIFKLFVFYCFFKNYLCILDISLFSNILLEIFSPLLGFSFYFLMVFLKTKNFLLLRSYLSFLLLPVFLVLYLKLHCLVKGYENLFLFAASSFIV